MHWTFTVESEHELDGVQYATMKSFLILLICSLAAAEISKYILI